jgi:nitroimidazol reductase NimA-like FMN-containing flavoprotein (pyridoxamine 5'-phosphate oxidase superfamily)
VRRSEKEITDRNAIDAVIRQCQVCRLGLADGDAPYIVPLSFGYDGHCLYFHCAAQGRKLDILRRNPRVCFEFDIVEGLIEAEAPCGWGMRYRSVIGMGTVHFVEDPEAKHRALSRIMAQYASGRFDFPEKVVDATVVFKVAVESVTGKQSAR